jgi:phage tail-like protein
MPNRTVPYSPWSYLISFTQSRGTVKPLGGFQEVVGLSNRAAVFRDPGALHPQKIPGQHKVGDITLKRGVVGGADLAGWIADARTQGTSAQSEATVTLRNEAGVPVTTWKLSGATPVRYTGPTLGGKGSGDIAIEELVLSAERIEIVPPK